MSAYANTESECNTYNVNPEYDGYSLSLTYDHALEQLVNYLQCDDRPIFIIGSGSNGKTTLISDVYRMGELDASWNVVQEKCSNNKLRSPQVHEVWVANDLSGNLCELFEQNTFDYYLIDMNNLRFGENGNCP